MIAFGPITSRRLGRSLGINNIPAKACSYSCVYCQIGRTIGTGIERQEFFKPQEISKEVEAHLEKLRKLGESVDYLTFVPNGEPTLDINLGRAIHALVPLGIKIGVITNASLLWRDDVRADLAEADWVSLKIDVAAEIPWRKLNRPHPALRMSSVIHGLLQFAESFSGVLVTETMLVRGVNDDAVRLQELSAVLSQIDPRRCYLATPIRPPAEAWVKPPTAEVLSACYGSLAAELPAVESLRLDENGHFTNTGLVDQDIVSITAVHPMEQTAVEEFLQKAGAGWNVIERLLENGDIREIEFAGKHFYRKSPNKGFSASLAPSTRGSTSVEHSEE